MPRGKVSAKNLISEYAGFKLGDPVILTGPATPKTVGNITKIYVDKFAKNEIAFVVSLKNPDDNNQMQDWLPIFSDELKKA